MSHTQEPWEQYGYIIYSPDCGLVCALCEPHPADGAIKYHPVEFGSPDREEIEANGRLIRLAPKLLRRCNAFLDWLASEGTNLDGLHELIEDLRETIKEIGGETENDLNR